MKFRKKIFLFVIILLSVFIINTCDNDNKQELAKEQSVKLLNLFNEGYSVTVKGYLTDTEWNGISIKIETALNNGFNSRTGFDGLDLQEKFRGVFQKGGIEIIIVKDPVGYTKWKTSLDGKRMWIAFGIINNNLQDSIVSAVEKMEMVEEGYAKINNENILLLCNSISLHEIKLYIL